MQFREIRDRLPLFWRQVDEAINNATRAGINWQDFAALDISEYKLAVGASEQSRHVTVALSPNLQDNVGRFFSALPLAAASMASSALQDRDQDVISLHPGTETLQIDPPWVYLPEGDGVGPLTAALRELPWMHRDFLQVLMGGGVSGKVMIDQVLELRSEMEQHREELMAPLWLQGLALDRYLTNDIFSKLDNPVPAWEVTFLTLRPIMHLMVPKADMAHADCWWLWLTVGMLGKDGLDRMAEDMNMGALNEKMTAPIQEQLARNISPLRAAAEVVLQTPKPFQKDSDTGFQAWIRLSISNIVDKAVRRGNSENPFALRRLGIMFPDDKPVDRIKELSGDERFRVVQNDLKMFADHLKRLESRSGKKERIEIGATMNAVMASVYVAAGSLIDYSVEERSPVRSFTGDEHAYNAALDEGTIYAFAPGRQLSAGETKVQEIGHLFLDMKGFTEKSARQKGLDLAEFMRWDFYDPLLKAVKNYYMGLMDLSDKGGIFINNLLGDAISLCGDVDSLLSFSMEVEELFGRYDEKLSQLQEVDAEVAAYENEKAELQEKVEKIQKQFAQLKETAAGMDAASAKEKAAKIKELYRKVQLRIGQLDRAIERRRTGDEEIPEYGTYIGFGPAPVYLDFADDVFGKLGVAIAETINEAARGTARDGSLYARQLSGYETARKSDPDLKGIAFRVCVGKDVAVDLTAVQQQKLLASMSDPEALHKIGPLSLARRDTIYNNGLALSAPALASLLRRARSLIRIARCEISAAEAASLLHPWWIPAEPLELFFLEQESSVTIIRYAGDMHFKGFESIQAKRIYEVVPESQPVYPSLLSLLGKAVDMEIDAAAAQVLGQKSLSTSKTGC